MKRTRMVIRNPAIWIATGLLAVVGCAWPRGGFAPRATAPSVVENARPEMPTASPEPEPPPRDATTLAAIESFLERTTDFGPATNTNGSIGTAALDVPSNPAGASRPEPGVLAEREPDAGRVLANTQLALPDPAARRPTVVRPTVVAVAVRPPLISTPATAVVQPSSAPNLPTDSIQQPENFNWERVLLQLEMESKTKRDFTSAWTLALVRLAAGRDVADGAASLDLPSGSRDVASHLFRAASVIRDTLAAPEVSAKRALDSIEDLRASLASRADLEVSGVELCRKVLTFGVHETLPSAELIAGRNTPVIAYCEVRNFRSEQDEAGAFKTRLSTRLEIFSSEGNSVWEKTEPEVVDTCRVRRTDFFLAQRIVIPATLPPADYVLKITVEDLSASKLGEGSKSFSLTVSTPVAKGR